MLALFQKRQMDTLAKTLIIDLRYNVGHIVTDLFQCFQILYSILILFYFMLYEFTLDFVS